jgi:endonuclease III
MLHLEEIVDRLAGVYGEPAPPPSRTLLELVLLENIAYLSDDRRREQAFHELKTQVGTLAHQILAASESALLSVAAHGILPTTFGEKLRRVAQLTKDDFGGDLEGVRTQPLADARRTLMRFPGIGPPGAEKILLLGRSHPVLGLDSNGVRVLTRLGAVKEESSYAATYRNVQAFVAAYTGKGFDWLIRAHHLLRQHGQELCKRSQPRCDRCPLNDACTYFANLR